MGIWQAQKEIIQSRFENATNLDQVMTEIKEEFVGLSLKLNVALSMLAWQPHSSLPMDFPPRASTVPNLMTPRDGQSANDRVEIGERLEAEKRNVVGGVGGNPSTSLAPRMDIPAFERDRPRWWIRRCERVFYQY